MGDLDAFFRYRKANTDSGETEEITVCKRT